MVYFLQAVSSTGNHITVIETTPGNYELLGNGQIMGGKIYPAGSSVLNSRYKAANIMSVTPAPINNSMPNQSRPSNSSSEQMKSPVASNSRMSHGNMNEEEDHE